MSLANRIYRGTLAAEEGITGLLKLREQSRANDLDAQKFNLLLAQAQSESDMASRKLTADMLTSTFKETSDQYKTLLGSDIVTDPAMKPLLDSAFREYRNAKKARDSFFGIETSPEMTALELVQHELASLKGENADPSMLRWTPKMRELLQNKYPDLDSNVLDGAEIIWKSMHSKLGKKDSEGMPTTGAEQLSEVLGLPADLGAAIVNAPGALLEAGQEWFTGKDAKPLYRITDPFGGRAFFKDLFGVEGATYGGPRSSQIPGMLAGAISSDVQAADMPTGETSQLLPKSAIDALRQEDKKSIGTGTGGMLSFADDIKLSRKAMEFIRNLAVYENEYGQEQGRKYVSKEFAKLSEKEQAEVVEYLESQQ